jgi:hypothetical protein
MMSKLRAILGAAAAAMAVGALAASAHSATIITAISGGPFSAANPIGAFPVMALLKADTYDFTFTLVAPIVGDTATQVQAQAQTTHTAELIQFDLYSGTPTGPNSYIATSPLMNSSILATMLGAGHYFVQIKPAYIAVNKEVDSGSLTTAGVPEPAGWALMIVGIGAVGGAMRRRTNAALA